MDNKPVTLIPQEEKNPMSEELKQSAYSQLDELRRRAVTERTSARDVELELQAAKANAEAASLAVTDAYADDNQRAITAARKAEATATAALDELQHRAAAATIRIERAQHDLDAFQVEHARDLLREREDTARTVAADLTEAVHSALRLARAFTAERGEQDRLVSQVPGATPRADGPPGQHAWEQALKALERAVADTPELPPPLPRWTGLEQRTQQNQESRRLKLQRKKRLNADEQAELDQIMGVL